MQPVDYPKSLMEVTAEKIRHAIVYGELPLGSKLSEQRLADTLGVSRSPVRDALAALQSQGLVSILPKRGTFVFTLDLGIVDELCEHRMILENAAIRLGIERNHAELLSQLETSRAQMQKALEMNDPHEYTMGDHKFHHSIIECAANRTLAKSYNQAISPLRALRTHLFTIMNETTDRSMGEHIAVIEATRDKDADLAVTHLSEHIGHLADAFRTNLSSDGAVTAQRAG